MGLFSNTVSSGRRWCRPTHRTTCCLYVTGANACCICIPSSATCFIIEMWGQGGGGGNSCCCMWNCVGGQAGDYGWKVCTTSGVNHILCVCVCQCSCQSPNACGMPGQFARVTNCTVPESICVLGGNGGCSVCFWTISGGPNCGSFFNSWERNKSHSNCAINCCCSPLSSLTCLNWCCDTCFMRSWFQGLGPFQCACCASFNFYVRGGCGWSDPTLMYCISLGATAFCGAGSGRGGSAYAGGAGQICDCSFGSYAYCGANGNVPGGGASGSGACGGGCCYGGIGGDGLVLISWS